MREPAFSFSSLFSAVLWAGVGLSGLGLTSSANAEYRAFELVITDSETGKERIELSNLDPLQFPLFHALKASEKISYRATWMCKGNTSRLAPICPNPKEGQIATTNRTPAPSPASSP